MDATELSALTGLVQQGPVIVWAATPSMDALVYVSDAYEGVFGHDPQAVMHEPTAALEHVHPEDEPLLTETIGELRDSVEAGDTPGERRIEYRMLDSDGQRRWVSNIVVPVYDEARLQYWGGFIRDITDEQASQARIERQRDYLDLLNGILSHDIRNDLQAIVASVEQFRSAQTDAESHVERALSNVDSAVATTETVRRLSELLLEAGATAEPTPLVPVLESEVESIRQHAPDVTVVLEGPLPDVYVRGDRLLGSVVHNLLSNAVNHNDHEDPEIVVGAEQTADTVVVTVADNGPGIDDKTKAHIFEPGYKGPQSHGTGMGLSLVSMAVEMYGGVVEVSDNDPRGTVMTLTLPVEADESA